MKSAGGGNALEKRLDVSPLSSRNVRPTTNVCSLLKKNEFYQSSVTSSELNVLKE